MNSRLKRGMGIKGKLIVMFVILITIPLVVLGVFCYTKSKSIMSDNLKDNSLQFVKQTKNSIDFFMKGYEESITEMSLKANVQQLISNPESLQAMLKDFKYYQKTHKNVSSIYIGTKDKGMYNYPHVEMDDGYDPTKRPWYLEAVSKKELIWTPPYIDASSKKLVITVAVPIYDSYNNSEFVGVLAIDLYLNDLSTKINEISIGKKGYPILLDKEINVMTHKNSELIGKTMPVEEIKKAIQGKDEGSVDYKLEEDNILYDKFATFGKIDKLNWTILVTNYKSDINEDTSSMLYTTIIFGIATLIVAITISFIFSSSLTKHIAELRHNIELIKKGDFTVRNDVKVKDEIGSIADGFNLMIKDVGNLIRKVQGLSSEVTMAAQGLAATSEETSASAEEVSRTVEDIAKGATDQALQSEKGAALTAHLAENFNKLTKNTEDMICSVNKVDKANVYGVNMMKELQEKLSRMMKLLQRLRMLLLS